MRYRFFRTLAVIIGLLLIAAGCGGQGNGEVAGETGSPDTNQTDGQQGTTTEGDPGEGESPNLRPVDDADVTWGTSSQGGLSYVVGTSMSAVLNEHVDGAQFNAVVTSGSVENARLIQTGEMQCGQTTSDVAHFAYNGGREFDEPLEGVRWVLNQWVSPENIIVPADSDIEALSDLIGKNIASTPGWGSSTFLPAILSGAGIEEGDYELTTLGGADGLAALRDGTIDAFAAAFGIPTPSVTELASTMDVRFVPISDSEAEQVLEEHPYWFVTEIPEGTYPGIDSDVQTIANNNVLLCSAELPADLIYNVAAVSYHYADDMREGASALDVLGTADMASEPVIPPHDGAEEFYSEVGISSE